MSGPLLYTIPPRMNGRPPDGQRMLEEARENCRRVIDELARDARSLEGRSPLVGDDALAEGRAAYDRARAAAEELLRRLDEDAPESP